MTPNRSAAADPKFPEAGLSERLAPPAALDADQQAAADELINGPRKGVYGPFRPLLHRPPLLRTVAKVGETLRYEGTLDAALREWTICVAARATSNVFEWDMHLPLAEAAGVSAEALACLERGLPSPKNLRTDLALARTIVAELVADHRLTDAAYEASIETWGESGAVELLALAGYFVMVCWLMNVARTPGPAT